MKKNYESPKIKTVDFTVYLLDGGTGVIIDDRFSDEVIVQPDPDDAKKFDPYNDDDNDIVEQPKPIKMWDD